MTHAPSTTELDARYSDDGMAATPWPEAADAFARAELYWLTTVRADGSPHVTPLIGVWQGGTLHFCTGPAEQKAKNLRDNPHVTMTTGTNTLGKGLDLVLNGTAARVTDAARLGLLAAAWESKYGPDWHFGIEDGAFIHSGGRAWVYEVVPATAYAFAKGPYGHTRYGF
ncbi:pyridoxamine 5'-phosphate oxidase family protein [Streptomyces sp. NPDC051940]|uniref:pyridoxamine 5'-phosphate oxidase family protein n=1 Tax=Streptomyces sp. NPDC051940 TaxID=3155675 RepID=UPI003432590B